MVFQQQQPPQPPRNPPAFNVPRVIVVAVAVLAAIHLLRLVLSPAADYWIVMAFGFVPARYGGEIAASAIPGGPGAALWSWLSYSGLHGDATHLIVNCLWLLAFGSAVARRFGWRRFLLLSALASIGGAGAHLAARWGDFVPVIGASAAISGHMGAAIRFVFAAPGISALGGGAQIVAKLPAAPLRDVIRNPRVIGFVAVWFAMNLLFGLGAGALPGMEGAGVAWEAHIGGFVAGLLLFSWLDPVPRRSLRVVGGDRE